ncbi:type I polyketide synthase [Aspergillus undulatus]|uniref:type I polyketide synthase n=1 Tax=Aspergillus undulatus TaxID=1810928 RepID=UPI003CCCD4FA
MAQAALSDEPLASSPWVDDPIAIIGIGLRLPGSIHTTEQFWNFLIDKRSGRCRVPASRYNIDAFLGPKGKAGHVCTEYGYFLNIDLAAVDSSFWSMSPKELELLDPQQRLMMEVVYECLENSGTADYKGKDIGLYVGALGEDWMDIQTKDPHHPGMHCVAGYGDFAISNRVSKELGLTGPSMTIRTACSSSLMALHAACQALHVGECSSAVVGGCNLILSPRMTTTMSELGVLSPQGNCRSFDAHADGYARGEAVNAIHIKRLSHAVRDGDPIRSVIRSVCINSDGPRAPLYIPSPESHELLIRRSHQLAGITEISETAMIECHGTGTMVGDIREGRAVAKVFGELGGVLIGSVKPNIGHSEGASGLSSIIKMVLALENRTIPPNINFTAPNPKIPFGPARLRVPVKSEPWPEGKAERVGLNGFGIGGANGHVLLESTKSVLGTAVTGHSLADKPQLLVFSGTHPETVKRAIASNLDCLKNRPDRIADASYTLACHRQILPHRAFAVPTGDSWDISPIQKAGTPSNLVWVFSGQGAQSAGMGRELLRNSAVAQDTIRHLDAVLHNAVSGQELSRPESASRLSQAEYSQPCCTAIQIALVDVLKSLKVRHAAVVGHSAGEIAAAYAAGALTAAEAILVSYHRGQVASRADKRGGIVAVSLSREQVSPHLTGNLAIACENSPRNVTLSGDTGALDTIADNLRNCYPDVSMKRLPVNCAYHSAQMNVVADDYMERLAALNIAERIEKLSSIFVSSVTGTPLQSTAELNAGYWCRNLTSPVLFYSAIKNIMETLSTPLFLEVGPHSVLCGPLRDIAPSVSYIPTLVRGTDAYTSILRTAGRLFQLTDIDLSPLYTGGVDTGLPPYQWQYDHRFWSESRVSRNWRFRQHPHHDILGSKIPDGNDTEPLWRSVIYLENVLWLRDHVVEDKVVFPQAAYIGMVGEAIRQLTGQHDYFIRHIEFLTVPTLCENQPLEILTQLRPLQQSEWYEFSITSHSEGTWEKLCSGQAKGGQDIPFDIVPLSPGPRKVKLHDYTRAMKKLGVDYGSRFCAMDKIAANVTACEATAEVLDTREQQETNYAIHPCTMNSVLQLFGVAEAQGRHFDHVAVPKYIDEIYVRSASGPIATQSMITSTDERKIRGDAAGFSDGKLVFVMRNAQFSVSKGRDTRGVDPHAGARLVWQPDIDAANITCLIRPTSDMSEHLVLVEELALACMIESEQHTPTTPALPHYAKYREWLGIQRRRAECGDYPNISFCQAISSMSSPDRKCHIKKLYAAALKTPARDVATAVIRVYHESSALFEGQVNPLTLLMKDDLLSAVYGFKLCDFVDFFRVFAHNRPTMNVLEIGAGTGGVTATILPALRGPHGERLYKSYTYTDISPGFFDSARERFSAYDGITYRALDISADVASQGFDASYDLVIASNVLHATPDLHRTLANVKALMEPNGKLFLQELAPVTKWINFIMGTLPGWWLSIDDRPWEPYISPERWDAELRAAGLSGTDAVVHDGQMNAHIISSVPDNRHETNKRATILCEKDSDSLELLLTILHAEKFSCDVRHLGDELPADQLVISLLEVDGPQLHSMTERRYLDLRDTITALHQKPMLWVTRSSIVNCPDPRYAATLGLLRTARRELGLIIATLELDVVDQRAFQAAITVADRVRNLEDSAEFDPLLEYAYADGTLMVGKFYPVVVGEELMDTRVPENHDSTVAVLETEKPGELDSLIWRSKSLAAPSSQDDWVEVQTRVVGVNSNDLLATGVTLGAGLGIECAGAVERVGPGVKNLRVGDRVIALPADAGAFATRFITSEKLCVRMARGLNWAEGATMPLAFATALYSLVDVARLKYGNTVLIQFACSDTGLAAIQICRIIGAEAYCTVINDAEFDYLLQIGIPKNRIFKYNDGRWAHQVLVATQGRGVDVVLNSLAGELVHALWKCVAEFGILVDLGHRESKHQPPINVFGGNRTFATVDLAQISLKRPEIIKGLLRRCMHHYALGELSPLPLQEFPAESVELAFRCMQNNPIGKVAVTMPEDSTSLPVAAKMRTPSFRSDAIHIIIGGLGGLGRSVSSWMACNGARHFLFFSPSAAKKEEDEFVLELRAQGCRVDLISGDVSKAEDVDALIKNLDADVPIAGVIQASMSLDQGSLSTMSFAQWTAAFAPKVQGTWNIHNTLLKYRRRTSYFLLFSSLSGLIGQTGHANYAAGNAFLDAFVQYRHSLGLPCSSLNIGVMEEVGYVSEQRHIIDHFVATGTHILQEQDLLDAVQLAIENSLPPAVPSPVGDGESSRWPSYVSHSQLCIGLRSTSPLDSPTNRISWRRDPRMALYHNLNEAETENTTAKPSNTHNDRALEHFLDGVKLKPNVLTDEASAELLGSEAGKALFNLMLRDHSELNLDASLSSLGADSLLAIKLKDWIRRKVEVEITVVQILASGSLRDLGRTVATAMLARAQGGKGKDEAVAAESVTL